MSRPKDTATTVIPGLRYQDAPKAIDWLCRAFGFEKHLVVTGEADSIAHAQLTFGNGMIMLGSAGKHGGGFDELMRTPGQVDNANTQALYVIAEDCRAHFEQARAAGAEIVLELKEQDYGGSGYTCRDTEGYVWSFGDYDPWAH